MKTYKGEVVEDEANESSLVVSDDRDVFKQPVLHKYDNPYGRDEAETGSRSKLELDILN